MNRSKNPLKETLFATRAVYKIAILNADARRPWWGVFHWNCQIN